MNDDTISRQAAIDALGIEPFAFSEYENGLHDKWEDDVEALMNLPPAQTERETAKFIRWMECKKTVNYISYTPHCKCSKCGTEFIIETIKYCYMCGARMER